MCGLKKRFFTFPTNDWVLLSKCICTMLYKLEKETVFSKSTPQVSSLHCVGPKTQNIQVYTGIYNCDFSCKAKLLATSSSYGIGHTEAKNLGNTTLQPRFLCFWFGAPKAPWKETVDTDRYYQFSALMVVLIYKRKLKFAV